MMDFSGNNSGGTLEATNTSDLIAELKRRNDLLDEVFNQDGNGQRYPA